MQVRCQHCGGGLYDDCGEPTCLACGRLAAGSPAGPLAPRESWPASVQDAGELARRIDQIGDNLSDVIPRVLAALTVDEAVTLYAALHRLGEHTWRARCRVVGEIFERLEGGNQARELQLAQLFSLSRSHIANILSVYWTFGATPLLDAVEVSQRVFVAAARAEDPPAALLAAREGGLNAETTRARGASVSQETLVYGRCLSCGSIGEVELMSAPGEASPLLPAPGL